MAKRNATDRILDGLLVAVARHGVGRVSMTDVAREAGVSRGTLYRYFPDQDALLSTLGKQVSDDVRNAIQEAVEAEPDLAQRFHVVLATLRDFVTERPDLTRLTESEPEFTLVWFRNNKAELSQSTREALEPLVGRRTKQQRRDLDELTDLIFRLAVSYNLVPPGDDEAASDWLAAVLEPYLKRYVKPRKK